MVSDQRLSDPIADARGDRAGAMPGAWLIVLRRYLIVGLGIAAMNADAAREVWEAARQEHRTAKA